MNQILLQTGVTFVAASFGAAFGALLTRRTEQFKHLQELRSAAYADFLIGFSKVIRAQRDKPQGEQSKLEEHEGRVLMTNSRARIAIYGGHEVVRALSRFSSVGTQTNTPEGRKAFADICSVMRAETGRRNTAPEDITRVLFSPSKDTGASPPG
jgi:hypothetical protein